MKIVLLKCLKRGGIIRLPADSPRTVFTCGAPDHRIELFLVDEGCSVGMGEALRNVIHQVHVIKGTASF